MSRNNLKIVSEMIGHSYFLKNYEGACWVIFIKCGQFVTRHPPSKKISVSIQKYNFEFV
jgi:hypothetical protein